MAQRKPSIREGTPNRPSTSSDVQPIIINRRPRCSKSSSWKCREECWCHLCCEFLADTDRPRETSIIQVNRPQVKDAEVPHRFRSKRQLWTYSGLGVETHDSAQHRYVDGQLRHSKKPQQVRGLNQNHNHEMKEVFKSAATSASRCAGPFHDFYASLLAKGMKPEMARLTLARKMAATTLTLWK